MKVEWIFTDYNGTVTKERGSNTCLKHIGMSELKRSWLSDWEKAKKLLEAKKHLEERVTSYEKDSNPLERLREIAEFYSAEVIQGMPMERILRYSRRYGRKAARKADGLFYEVLDAGIKSEIPIIMLTRDLDFGVSCFLTEIGLKYQKKGKRFHYVYVDGSTIEEENWIAKKLILRNCDKAARIEDYIRNENLNPSNVAFIGNDMIDAPCADVVGMVIVPSHATDGFKQHMASEYGKIVRTPSSRPGEVYRALTMD